MFQISNDVIMQKCTPLVFNKGMEYYRKKRIKSINFKQDKLLFEASVLGTRSYYVNVQFDTAGSLRYSSCSCPAFEGYSGICKHIAAVLLAIKDNDDRGFFDELQSRNMAKQIFNFFQNRPAVVKTPVTLEVIYEFYGGKRIRQPATSALSLRMGLNGKLYVVRNIRKLFECIDNNEELEFGKGFAFDPSRHDFGFGDRPVMDMIREIYEAEKLLGSSIPNSAFNGLLRDKQALLTSSMTKRFFEIYKDRSFKAEIQGEFFENMRIYQEDFPAEFFISREGNQLILDLNINGTVIPLTDNGEYFFMGGSIYKVSQKQQEGFKPFYMALLSQRKKSIRFLEEDKERFISEVLPFAENAGRVVIDEKLQTLIEKVDIEPEIYLDKSGDLITADVKFVYGEKVINPFAPAEKSELREDKILLRDVNRERVVLDILAEGDFKVRNIQVYLDEEEKIYDLVKLIIPKLQEYASVFYSESFRNMRIRDASSFSGGIRLNRGTDLLEFNLNIDGMDNSDLIEIFRNFREKKRYYRLKDGSFLPLDSEDISHVVDLAYYLGLDGKELKKGFIEIPKYRAMYLEQHLKQSGLKYIEMNHAFKELVRNVCEPSDADLEIPLRLKNVLREYQKFGFRWMKTLGLNGFGGILADDMGLGKTLQFITLVLHDFEKKGRKPSLVVAPTSLVYNWCAEIEKFAPDLKYTAISGNKEEREKQLMNIEDFDIVVTSYPLIRRDKDEYRNFSFRYCILDEAQHIKNPDSQNARSVKEIKAERRFALTGTPMENSLTELWSIFDFVMPGYLFSHSRFVQRYEKPVVRDGDRKALEGLGMHIRPFILRRLKSEVLKELPEKIENKMVAEMAQEQKAVYLAYLRQIRDEIEAEIKENGFERSHIKILAGLTRLRQICCHPSVFLEDFSGDSGKLLLLQEIITDCIEGGHRILLFSQFTSMLSIIRRWLGKNKISHLYLDGSTKAEDRALLVKEFNQGQGSVFLISLKAGGTGLNLTGADTVIHYDPWWNPAVEDQATDRAHRIGQNRSVHVMKLITKGTIEEKIYELQERKKRLVDSVIQPGETLLSKMSEEEVRALLE